MSSDTYYLGNRNYQSATGRFPTEDPINAGLNWYSYCENNPVNRIDPMGLDSYIHYDPNAISGNKIHTFLDEANIPAEQLEKKYGTKVHIYQTDNAANFKTVWNEKVGFDTDGNPVNIEEVYVALHGSAKEYNGKGYGFMYFEKGSRITISKDIKGSTDSDVAILDLGFKQIKHLNFSSCNTGNPDIINVGTIFNYTTKQLESGAYGEYWYQEWRHQPTYWKFVEKDQFGIPIRVRQGKVKMYGIYENYFSSPFC